MTRRYPPILSVDLDTYREGGVARETFEGTRGNIRLYFHTRSDATARSDPVGRGPRCGYVVY